MVLTALAKPLAQQLQRAEAVAGAAQEGLRDHRRIAGAIAERSPEKAREAMRAHMENAERYWRIANSGLASQDVLDSVSEVSFSS
jgi:DNA-binding FadR family transcriptional regulator